MFWTGFIFGMMAGALLGISFACFAIGDDYDDEVGEERDR